MAFITLGADEARSQIAEESRTQRVSALGKLLTGALLVGGAVVALKGRSSRSGRAGAFSDDWGPEVTKPIPKETVSQLMESLKRTSSSHRVIRETRASDFSDDWGHEPTKPIPVETSGQLLAMRRR